METDNIVHFPAGRVHKRYAAMIPRLESAEVGGGEAEAHPSHPPIHPGVIMLGLITLWAFWCAGVR